MARLLLLGLFASIAGCTLPPDTAPWRDDQKTIRNETPAARGSLVVETAFTEVSDQGDELHAPFYVYDPSGRYLTWVPNNSFLPNRLAPGRYVIVSRVSRQFKRVQVEIQNGATTTIRLKDFKEAPSADPS